MSRAKYLYYTTILDLLPPPVVPTQSQCSEYPVTPRTGKNNLNLLCASTERAQNSHSPSPLFSFDSLYGLNSDLHTFLPFGCWPPFFLLEGTLVPFALCPPSLPPDLNDFELLIPADIAPDFVCRLVRVLEVPSSDSTSRTPFPKSCLTLTMPTW